ncbi:DHH family phosphoesterase [Kutzneria sp. CA-103260]|uniref:DHH family phosphoesterase n=1 Tax=Kutzneria sp. CA-103260 TaxID=2802641 RepID=UPI001BA79593|nr:bifunctional oligoribonuclease/PAP phosphatase NrnA [Kutzneria sp. CA-103260]QUQ71608.1 phosphoesterase, RecJ-like protein [Kutzneria sp. CA-103260]
MSASDQVDVADAAALLAAASDVTLLAHVNPDADALGSALALGLALQRRGATVRVSFGYPAEIPASLRSLDSAGLFVPATDVPPRSDLLVALDTGSVDRLGPLGDRVAAAPVSLVVDHHVSNTRYGSHNLVDDRAEATAVIVARLLDALAVEIDEPIARCLYAGVATDTVSFRFAKPETHRLAARLLEAGVDGAALIRGLMDSHPFAWLGMLAAVLGAARLEPDAAQGLGFVHAIVRQTDSAGVRSEEVESVIDVVRSTAEAEVAAVLKETPTGDWTVSLRAVGRLDVRSVAVRFGGGGHRLAAGFTGRGTADEVIAGIRDALATAPAAT